MSRQSGSSRHRSHGHGSSSRNTDSGSEDLVEQVKSIVNLLYEVVSERSGEWETYLASARSAIAALDRLRFFRETQRFAEQVWILHGLQEYAFHDSESGCIQDIAVWAEAAWSRVLRNYHENEEVLTGMFAILQGYFPFTDPFIPGLGRNWLQRSQENLAIIQREEGNDSSSQGSGSARNISELSSLAMNFINANNQVAVSADPRRQGPLYAEARALLQPAVDYYARAVRVADASGTISGELLSQVCRQLALVFSVSY